MAEPLTWRNVSTPNLRDFIGSDGDRDVARILKSPNHPDWTWSVYVIVPARSGLTSGHEVDPREARRKVEEAWTYARANGRPVRTAVTEHLHVVSWNGFAPNGPGR